VNKLRNIHLFSEPDQTDDVLATAVFTNLNKIWLAIKSKEEYLIDDLPSSDWARLIHDYMSRRAHTQVKIYTKTGGGYHDTMIYEKRNSMSQNLQSNFGNIVGDATTDLTRNQRIYSYNHDGTELISRQVLLDTEGICLHGDIPLLMTDPYAGEEAFLDAYDKKDVYVEFTEGASTGNIYVVLDELQKTYPS